MPSRINTTGKHGQIDDVDVANHALHRRPSADGLLCIMQSHAATSTDSTSHQRTGELTSEAEGGRRDCNKAAVTSP